MFNVRDLRQTVTRLQCYGSEWDEKNSGRLLVAQPTRRLDAEMQQYAVAVLLYSTFVQGIELSLVYNGVGSLNMDDVPLHSIHEVVHLGRPSLVTSPVHSGS